MAYKCPYAVKDVANKFLMCKTLMKDGVDYTVKENALRCFCAYQRYCKCVSGVINSEGAKSCYEFHSQK